MRLTAFLPWAGALVGPALGRPAAADTATAYYDSETGFTFSEVRVSYTLTSQIAYRIAVPSTAVNGQPFDVVLQVVAPTAVGWAGMAWGGTMLKNPLTVGWANGNSAQISSRWATAHSLPAAYTGATYQRFTTGNRVNSTHYQFTAKCTGCSSWVGTSTTYLNPKGTNRFALAYSTQKPSTPSSNTSSFPSHDNPVYWSQDLTQGSNANFADLVKKNGGS